MTGSDTRAGCFAVLGTILLFGGLLFLWIWTLGHLRGTADVVVEGSWRIAALALPIGLGLLARARWAGILLGLLSGGYGLFIAIYAFQALRHDVPAYAGNLAIACLLQTPLVLTALCWHSLTWLGTWPPWRRSTKT